MEHDIRLHVALVKIQAAGLTLNKEKCEFNKERLTFPGHIVDKNVISADTEKISRDGETPVTPRATAIYGNSQPA